MMCKIKGCFYKAVSPSGHCGDHRTDKVKDFRTTWAKTQDKIQERKYGAMPQV